MSSQLFADLRDNEFKLNPNSRYVVGFWSEPYMQQFPGIGYSAAEFKFKAVLIDGKLHIPCQVYANNTPKNRRDYANYPVVLPRLPIPDWAIKPVE